MKSIDQITREQTAFTSLDEMLAGKGGYRPSIEVTDFDRYRMAEAYDAAQIERGDERRAFRYGGPNSGAEAYERAERAAYREHRDWILEHPTTPAELAKLVKARAKRCIRDARMQNRWHFTHRGIEVVPLDSKGERAGDPDFLDLSQVSGKALSRAVATLDDCEAVCIQGGLDAWDSLQDQLQGGDYEPGFEWWEIDVPLALFDR